METFEKEARPIALVWTDKKKGGSRRIACVFENVSVETFENEGLALYRNADGVIVDYA